MPEKQVRDAVRGVTNDDPLLAASGMIDGLPSDLCERLDEYLDATVAITPDEDRR